MSISSALYISSAEIGNINAQISLVSHNIANANTPDYHVEQIDQSSLYAGGFGMGAIDGTVKRAVDQQAQSDLLLQNSSVAALQTQQSALQQIDVVEGAVGGGTDIGSLLGSLSNGFSALASNPQDQTQQQRVVGAAQSLASQINSISNAVGAQRQAAQDTIVANVSTLNSTITSLGMLSQQIIMAKSAGLSTADLENARDAQEDSLSKLISVKFLSEPNGDLQAITSSGLNLPLHSASPPFQTQNSMISANSFAPGGGVPAILLNGQDVTNQLTGGQIGGNLALRDATLPTIQANIDEFAYSLSHKFDAQGLTLFTDSSGRVPSSPGSPVQSGYVGYASTIQVNPTVIANPTLVRDGTHAVTAGTNGATGFTPNPAGGPAGFNALILRVVQYTFGRQVSAGVPQSPSAVAGLGPSGLLSAGFAAPLDLASLATSVSAAEAQESSTVTAQLSNAQTTQTMLTSNLTSAVSTSIDGAMSQIIGLQSAYGANAHVIAAIQSMWTQLLQAIQ